MSRHVTGNSTWATNRPRCNARRPAAPAESSQHLLSKMNLHFQLGVKLESLFNVSFGGRSCHANLGTVRKGNHK